MTARKKIEPDEVTVEELPPGTPDEALPPADEAGYDEHGVELDVDEVVHAVRRPGGLVAEYIKGADGVTRREVRRLTDAELEAEATA